MIDLSFISSNGIIIVIVIAIGFLVWKFGLQPRLNEGQSLKPPKDVRTFGEKLEDEMEENLKTDINF